MTHPYRGACLFCRHWTGRQGQSGLCRSPRVLPRVIDIFACREDETLCGDRGRWWEPLPESSAAAPVPAAQPTDLEDAA